MAHHFKTMAGLKEQIWRLAEAARKETGQSYGSIATAAARGSQHACEHVVNLLDDSFIGPDVPSAKRLTSGGDRKTEGQRGEGASRSAGQKPSNCASRPPSTPVRRPDHER